MTQAQKKEEKCLKNSSAILFQSLGVTDCHAGVTALFHQILGSITPSPFCIPRRYSIQATQSSPNPTFPPSAGGSPPASNRRIQCSPSYGCCFCRVPVRYHWGRFVELEVSPEETPRLMTLHPRNTNVLQNITYDNPPYPPNRSNPGQKK